MLTKDDILKQFSAFKTKGKPATVHTSLKAIGEIEGGADVLLSALIKYFTQNNGLLVIPTHTWNTRILDLNKAETCIGRCITPLQQQVHTAYEVIIRHIRLKFLATVYGCIQYATLDNVKVQLCNVKKLIEVLRRIYQNANGQELLYDKTPLDGKLWQ